MPQNRGPIYFDTATMLLVSRDSWASLGSVSKEQGIPGQFGINRDDSTEPQP